MAHDIVVAWLPFIVLVSIAVGWIAGRSAWSSGVVGGNHDSQTDRTNAEGVVLSPHDHERLLELVSQSRWSLLSLAVTFGGMLAGAFYLQSVGIPHVGAFIVGAISGGALGLLVRNVEVRYRMFEAEAILNVRKHDV